MKFCLCLQSFVNKEICMKTRLYGIFKTTNAVTLISTILESYSFNVYIVITLAFLTKSFFTKPTKASQNKLLKIIFLPISTLNLTFFKNMEKDTSHWKICNKTDHSSWKYGPSNLPFRLTLYEKNHKVPSKVLLSYLILWSGNLWQQNDAPSNISRNYLKGCFLFFVVFVN